MKPVLSGLDSQHRWGPYSPSLSVNIANNSCVNESLLATFSHVIKWKKLKLRWRFKTCWKPHNKQIMVKLADKLRWANSRTRWLGTLWKSWWKSARQKITPWKTTTSDSEVLKGCRWAETSLQRNAAVLFQGHTMNAQVSWSLKTMHSKRPVLLKSGSLYCSAVQHPCYLKVN